MSQKFSISGFNFAKTLAGFNLTEFDLLKLKYSQDYNKEFCDISNMHSRIKFGPERLENLIKEAGFVSNHEIIRTPIEGSITTKPIFGRHEFTELEKNKIKINGPKYGYDNEKSFLAEFLRSDVYETIFEKQNLCVEKCKHLYSVETFGGFPLEIRTAPDFVVVDKTTREIAGFIELKSRLDAPILYTNLYNVDITQTAIYSLIKNGTKFTSNNFVMGQTFDGVAKVKGDKTRCWIVQNYENNKYIVNELTDDIPKIIGSMVNQFHRAIFNTNEKPKGLDVFFNKKTDQAFNFTRENIYGYIVQLYKMYEKYNSGELCVVELEPAVHKMPTADRSNYLPPALRDHNNPKPKTDDISSIKLPEKTTSRFDLPQTTNKFLSNYDHEAAKREKTKKVDRKEVINKFHSKYKKSELPIN